MPYKSVNSTKRNRWKYKQNVCFKEMSNENSAIFHRNTHYFNSKEKCSIKKVNHYVVATCSCRALCYCCDSTRAVTIIPYPLPSLPQNTQTHTNQLATVSMKSLWQGHFFSVWFFKYQQISTELHNTTHNILLNDCSEGPNLCSITTKTKPNIDHKEPL